MHAYAPRQDRKPRGRVLAPLLFAVALLAAGAAVGYLVASLHLPPRAAERLPRAASPPAPGDGAAPPQDGGEQRPAAAPPETRTNPYTVFVFRTRYPACDGEVARTGTAGAAGAGLSQGEVAERYPGWSVELFRPGQVVLARTRDGPCPDEAVYRTVTMRDGRVVVYAGRPGRLGPLLQETDIRVDRLLPRDRERLARGIEVRGDEGVWRLLEGLDRG